MSVNITAIDYIEVQAETIEEAEKIIEDKKYEAANFEFDFNTVEVELVEQD